MCHIAWLQVLERKQKRKLIAIAIELIVEHCLSCGVSSHGLADVILLLKQH